MWLGELVPQFGSNHVIALANMAIRGFQVTDSFDIQNDDVAHVAHSGGCPVGRAAYVRVRRPGWGRAVCSRAAMAGIFHLAWPILNGEFA
jgi:hypothetical protein